MKSHNMNDQLKTTNLNARLKTLNWNEQLKSLVRSERKLTHEILLRIQVLDLQKSYCELGYSSLFEYLTKEIGYSEGAAQRRISAARLLKDVPQIEETLKNGELNLNQVALAQVAIKQQEKSSGIPLDVTRKLAIVEKLRAKNTIETQKTLMQELPNYEPARNRITPTAEDRVSITLNMKASDWARIKSFLAQHSHSVPDQKLESLLLYLALQAEKTKARQDEKMMNGQIELSKPRIVNAPNRSTKPGRLSARDENINSPQLNQAGISNEQTAKNPERQNPKPLVPKSPPLRRYIPVAVKRTVFARAEGRCQYKSESTGHRCESQHFLEIEHIVPKAFGGGDDLSNLRLFCRSHNGLAAKQMGLS